MGLEAVAGANNPYCNIQVRPLSNNSGRGGLHHDVHPCRSLALATHEFYRGDPGRTEVFKDTLSYVIKTSGSLVHYNDTVWQMVLQLL
jgi:hypothetical protein